MNAVVIATRETYERTGQIDDFDIDGSAFWTDADAKRLEGLMSENDLSPMTATTFETSYSPEEIRARLEALLDFAWESSIRNLMIAGEFEEGPSLEL